MTEYITSLLLILVGIEYIGIAAGYLISGRTGLAIAFAAYAVANGGLYLAGK